jgi:hypothetical protein
LRFFPESFDAGVDSCQTEIENYETSSLAAAEEELLAEIAQLDRDKPGWNRAGLLAGAERLLRNGTEFRIVAAVYGDEIAMEADQHLHQRIA